MSYFETNEEYILHLISGLRNKDAEIYRLTAQVEALESAIKTSPTCYTCVNFYKDNTDDPCYDCDHEENWQFDYERFAGGERE